MPEIDARQERAILVALATGHMDRWEVEEHLEELALLADTAGALVVEKLLQERPAVDATYFIGKGKAEYLRRRAAEEQADLIIFDDDLSPAQARNLEQLCEGTKVIDRSGLILDIFARRAKTRESRTQVELAQLRYLLPRLTRQWTHLSRQVGGIGTRGPGETQLEVDRRLVRRRISRLVEDLVHIEKQRKLRRRHRDEIYKAALVGYTNVGKSTLMNALTNSGVFTENRLFATLDATIRLLEIAEHDKILLIDTVGFIRKLPHHLVASFKSTLEEVREADLLLHVIDISHPQFEEQIKTVQHVLNDLGLQGQKVLHVFNKIDAIDNPGLIAAMREKYAPSIFVAAARGMFLQELKERLRLFAHEDEQQIELIFQSHDGEGVARVYALAEVLQKTYENGRVVITARTTAGKAARLRSFAASRVAGFEKAPSSPGKS